MNYSASLFVREIIRVSAMREECVESIGESLIPYTEHASNFTKSPPALDTLSKETLNGVQHC